MARFRESLLPSAFGLLVVCGALLLFADSRMKASSTGARQIGVVSFQKGKSQRKSEDSSIFYGLGEQQPVFNGDLVRTSHDTTATFLLSDGTRVELGELSMAALHLSQEETKVRMDYGSVRSQGGSKRQLRLQLGDQALVSKDGIVSGGRARGAENASLAVESGTGILESKGKNVTVAEGQQILMSKDSAVQTALPIIPLEPAPGAVVNASEEQKAVTFRWSGSGQAKLLIQRVGQATPVESRLVDSASAEVTLTPGRYSWTVLPSAPAPPLGSASAEAPIVLPPRSLFVRSVRAPSLLEPGPEAMVRTADTTAPVILRWEAIPFARSYVYEISRSRDFAATVNREETQSASSFRRLGPGTYYWRVSTIARDGSQVPVSAVGSFQVERFTSLPAPAAVAPQNGKVESRSAAQVQGVLFSWRSAVQGTTLIEVAADDGFRQVLAQKQATGSSTLLKLDARAGTYFWRVRNRLADGRLTPPSATSVLLLNDGLDDIVLRNPPDGASYGALAKVRLAWDGGGSGSRFRLTVASDPQFQKPVRVLSTAYRSAELSDLPPGKYHWRVLSGTGATDTSVKTRSFEIQPKLPPPVIAEPAPGSVVDMAVRDSLHFRWSPVSGAPRYRLMLKNGSGQTIFTTVVNATDYRLTDLGRLDVGRFTAEVIPLTGGGTAGTSAISSFRIALGRAPVAPEFADKGTRFVPAGGKP